jgi:very-short-patch-repair endonuclease
MPLRLSRRSKAFTVKVPRANAADGLVTQIKQLGWREPVREHRFHHVRMWRFDLAWPDYHLAVEVDGGGFVGGRHGRGMGIEKDCEKLAHAVIDGWRVMRVTPTQIRKGLAIQWVGQMLVDWGVR